MTNEKTEDGRQRSDVGGQRTEGIEQEKDEHRTSNIE